MEVNIHQAKTHLSRLLQRVAGGEEITIARAGVPVARLVAAYAKAPTRPMGMDRDTLVIADDFDAPLPPDIMAAFLGESAQGKKSVTKKSATKKGTRRKRA